MVIGFPDCFLVQCYELSEALYVMHQAHRERRSKSILENEVARL